MGYGHFDWYKKILPHFFKNAENETGNSNCPKPHKNFDPHPAPSSGPPCLHHGGWGPGLN